MNPFKVGDKVRFVSEYYPARKGDTGVVTRLEGSCTRVRLDRDGSTAAPYNFRLELVQATPYFSSTHDFKAGDRVKVGPKGHYMNDRSVSHYGEAEPGDVGTVTGDFGYSTQTLTHVRWDGKNYNSVIDKGCLVPVDFEPADTPPLDFVAGSEPDSVDETGPGEQYLNRAADWLSENLNADQQVLVTDALLVAQFLEYVDRKSA